MGKARNNPALVILGNPQGLLGIKRSEGKAWKEVFALAQRMLKYSARGLPSEVHEAAAAIAEVAQVMLTQLEHGVHQNPRGLELSRNVQAIVYIHTKDGERYVHGFGNAELDLKDRRDGTLEIRGLQEQTGVQMVGSADKRTVTLRGVDGQTLWDLFNEDGA